MNKTAAISELCRIASDVGSKHFQSRHRHDCICDGINQSAVIDSEVIEYIWKAVRLKMKQDARAEAYRKATEG